MKTLKNLMVCIFTVIVVLSCETDVLETDNTAPTFNLRISGDGFLQNFTEEDDFESFQLNLNSESEYQIVFSQFDEGGIKRARLGWITEILELNSELPEGWTLLADDYFTFVVWEGDRENPVTGSLFTANFIAHAGQYDLNTGELRIFAEDFGGESGDTNQINPFMNIMIGYDLDTEVVLFD